MLMQYLGAYDLGQTGNINAKIMNNFAGTVTDVYLTGNPADFGEFEEKKINYFFHTEDETLRLKSSASKYYVYAPFLVSSEEQVILHRVDYDYGWWKFSFVEALPETTFVFTLEDNSAESRELVRDIVNSFPHTLYFDTPILFGFCDGYDLLDADFCGGSGDNRCHRDYFLNNLSVVGGVSFSKCSAQNKMGTRHRLITISNNCNPTYNTGLCIDRLAQKMYLAGNTYDYYNGAAGVSMPKARTLDILPLLIGWEDETLLNENLGDDYYKYLDEKFVEQAQFAAQLGSERIDIITTSGCNTFFSPMEIILDSISTASDRYDIISYLEQSKNQHKTLVLNGCDYQ